MIELPEIRTIASDLSLAPEVIEKDYVLGWILGGIFASAKLAPAWVFKGGTCLKKCFFETYRFSEDLDFTITDKHHLDERFLKEAFAAVSTWILDASGIEIPIDQLRFDVYSNKRGGLSCEGRLYYRGPIKRGGNSPRIKLDLTVDEVLVLPPVERRAVHPYSDRPAAGLTARCYAFEEVFAEKTRALGERSRPRDLYDVVNLFRSDERRPAASVIADILRKKCEFKGAAIPNLAALQAAEPELRSEWESMLGHQLPVLPPFESFWEVLPAFFNWLATGASPARPAAASLQAGERLFRPAIGGFRVGGIAHSRELEIIRFAAANRLCVDLGYKGEVRRIEPYSLRRTAQGEILLMSVHSSDGEVRSYRVDRIESASVTRQVFTPRYAVELSASEVAIPPLTSRPRVETIRATSKVRTESPRRPASPLGPVGGPTYVYQCGLCGKKFNRSRADGTLKAHRMPSGLPCSGRTGFLVTTRY